MMKTEISSNLSAQSICSLIPSLLPSNSQREFQVFWKEKERITAFYLATKHEMVNCFYVLNCGYHLIHYECKYIFGVIAIFMLLF